MSNWSKWCPWALIFSTSARLNVNAFFLKAYCWGYTSVYALSYSVSILWKTRSIVSWIAIGLKSLFFFGMNTSLNSYKFGSLSISSELLSSALKMIANFLISVGLLLAKYLRCFGPMPDGPGLLPFFRCCIVCSILSSVIFSNPTLYLDYFSFTFIVTYCGSGNLSAISLCFYSMVGSTYGSTLSCHWVDF